jgi:hypothetical protein
MDMEGWRQSVQSVTPFSHTGGYVHAPQCRVRYTIVVITHSLNFVSRLSGNGRVRVGVDASHTHTLFFFSLGSAAWSWFGGCRGVFKAGASSEEPPQSQGRGLIPHPPILVYTSPPICRPLVQAYSRLPLYVPLFWFFTLSLFSESCITRWQCGISSSFTFINSTSRIKFQVCIGLFFSSLAAVITSRQLVSN